MKLYSRQEKWNLWHDRVKTRNTPIPSQNLGEFNNREIVGCTKIVCIEELRTLLEIVTLPGEPLSIHSYSTGKNWGLGSFLPVENGSILLDLSQMNKIIDLDLKAGMAIIEPGVTQLQLSKALESTSYMLNVTSSHTTTSILGNALDRGVGFHRQRDQDLMGAEVLLSTGETIQLGGYWPWITDPKKAFCYKHGLGPNLLPLLYQTNLGIITKGVISLLPRSERILVYKIIFSEENFEAVIAVFSQFYQDEIIKSIMKIYNSSAASMYSGSASAQAKSFYGYFSLEGPISIVEVKLQHVLSFLKALEHVVLEEINSSSKDILSKTIYSNFHGNPTYNDAMINASFKVHNGDIDTHSQEGWLSFLPIIPFDAHSLQNAFALIQPCAQGTNVHPMATMNIVSKSAVDLVIALRFKRQTQDIAEAHQVLDALYQAFAQEGFYPYRLDVDHMDFLGQQELNSAYIKILRSIKHVFDPHSIMMPGRYIS